MKVREGLKKAAKDRGVKLSYMPFIIKATSLALSQFPMLNASVDEKVENLLHRKHHNISIAMDTRDGLAVPNIKHCEAKTIWQIAEELNRLSEASKGKGYSRDDLSDGTFSLSNIGSIGGTHMRPVILPPQVCIGAIGKVQKVVGVDERQDDQVCIQHVCTISWAADHRVVDGATLARFSNLLKNYIEKPESMLAELR